MKLFATSAVVFVITSGIAAHAAVTVDIIAEVGRTVPGSGDSTVATLNAPFTDGNGKVGFTGNLSPADNFVWYDDAIVWRNSMVPDPKNNTLSGAEGTMGVSNTGDFIYSPSYNGNDAVWTAAGLLAQRSDPAPDIADMYIAFCSRPTMVDDGTAFWMSGITPTQGSATSQNRVFYKASNGVISKVFAGGETIDGQVLSTSTSNFTYWVSRSGQHHIHEVTINTPTRLALMVNGVMAHIATEPTGQGANWQNFDAPSINNSGNYIFAGDDSGATATDGFIAYNGTIMIREGDTVDGVSSASGWAFRAASINNNDRVAFIWGTGTNEHLFEGHGPALASTTKRILSTGEDIDTDGDGIADETVTDFNASVTISPGLDFSDHRFIYVEVDLRNIATQTVREAIIRVPLPTLCAPDITGDNTVNVNDLLAVINGWGACSAPCPPTCAADVTQDCSVNVNDLLAVINAWGPCPQ